MMLRILVLVFGIVLLGIGLFLLISGRSELFQPALIWGIILVVAVLCERWRYRARHDETAQWQQTGERFQDPETGETVEVQYDPLSGERRYVQKKDHHPPPTA
jgi:hypothetical protein